MTQAQESRGAYLLESGSKTRAQKEPTKGLLSCRATLTAEIANFYVFGPDELLVGTGVRDVWTTDKMQFGVGSDLTFYSKPALLDTIYGNNPISWKLFFGIPPGRMDRSMHRMHGTNGNMNKPSL